MKRTFELVEGGSRKFWHIEVEGARTLVTFGKLGTTGQSRAKDFADEEAAQKECDKLVREKVGKGYVETTPAAGGLGEALEAAVVEAPDEKANHAAYADWLSEQAGAALRARGEFIQVQLALEDEALPRAARSALEKRERELLDAHARQWLGELGTARGILPKRRAGKGAEPSFRFARGWLDTLRVETLGALGAGALARAPQVRLLRRLLIDDLRLGSVTDEGAAVLASSPALKRLELLDLSRNALTEDGIARLQATGVRLRVDGQHDEDDDAWFEVGDYE